MHAILHAMAINTASQQQDSTVAATVRLPEDLYTEVKVHAAKTKGTVQQIVTDALVAFLKKNTK